MISGERLDSAWVRSWCERTSAALEALQTSFAERHGFPPGENAVLLATDGSSKATGALVDLTPIPSDLTTLYWVLSEVSMPDVGCGYFIHSPATVDAHFREHGSVRLDDEMPALVFAGDGGGHLFAVAGSGRVWKSASASWCDDFRPVACGIQEFLEQLSQEITDQN
ncbi:hypothetical protein H9Y04_39170 [Streptomyces sp. TRM66268-LWL]|uniref:SMI1/KNR4 family protein n=1 Tax=Streptomyces polyasparticus TaxID=2767826 RepID=A0ABR7SST8_9ACTN|nr:hypothetical protein [Streptomyces polyasparticus]MBC9718565.1 hypothetical protein [Streptomyces polyasparticus]